VKVTDPRNQCDRCGVIAEGRSGGGYEDDQLPLNWVTLRVLKSGTTDLVRELCVACADHVIAALKPGTFVAVEQTGAYVVSSRDAASFNAAIEKKAQQVTAALERMHEADNRAMASEARAGEWRKRAEDWRQSLGELAAKLGAEVHTRGRWVADIEAALDELIERRGSAPDAWRPLCRNCARNRDQHPNPLCEGFQQANRPV
jgi:hypothetical protein